MKRRRRILLNVLASLSALLSLLLCVLWIRGHWIRDQLYVSREAGIYPNQWSYVYSIECGRGEIEVVVRGQRLKYLPNQYTQLGHHIEWRVKPATLRLRWNGFRHVQHQVWPGPGWEWYVNVPTWLPLILLMGPTVIAIILRQRARKSIGENRCSVCGYDLRATSDRCPECGTAVTVTRGASA